MKHFLFFILAVFGLYWAYYVTTQGMFMDGLYYGAISSYLANSTGTFWNPFFSQGLAPSFHEHPPLAFGLQAMFFKVFGDVFWVERMYGTLLLVAHVVLIDKLYRLVFENQSSLLAICIWIWMPVVSWCFGNNMLENTMSVFVLISAIAIFNYLNKPRPWFLIVFTMAIYLGFLTKGFTALFTLSIPFWYAILIGKNSISFYLKTYAIIVLCIIAIVSTSHLLWTEFTPAVKQYFNQQVVNSIKNVKVVEHRWQVLLMLFNQLIAAIILVVLGVVLSSKRTLVIGKKQLLMLFIGFSGVFPIMITYKQRDFYLLAAMSFFAIAIANILQSIQLKKAIEQFTISLFMLPFKWLTIAIVFIGIGTAWARYGTIQRDNNLIADVDYIDQKLHINELTVDSAIYHNYQAQGYFARRAKISLVNKNSDYKLLYKSSVNTDMNYKPTNDSLKLFKLYRLR